MSEPRVEQAPRSTATAGPGQRAPSLLRRGAWLLLLPLWAGAAGAAPSASSTDVLTLPLRAHGEGAGAPALSTAPGVLLIEIPGARMDRTGGTTAPVGSRLSMAVGEILQANSRSRQRATVTLRLRPGVVLRPEQVLASVEDGALRLALRPEAATPVAPPATRVTQPSEPLPSGAAARRSSGSTVGVAGAAAAGVPWARALAGLGGLGVAALLALRLRPRRRIEVRPAAIDIIASRALGRNQRLLVVDVEQQRFLLAASEPGGLRLVSPIGPDGRHGGLARADEALGDVFADMLAGVTGATSAHPVSGATMTATAVEAEAGGARAKAPAPSSRAEAAGLLEAATPTIVLGAALDFPGDNRVTATLASPRSAAPAVAPAEPVPLLAASAQTPEGTTPQKGALTLHAQEPETADEAPAQAAPASAERRPNLQVIEGARAARGPRSLEQRAAKDAAHEQAGDEGPRSRADLESASVPRSSDVAGLVALRQHRQGGRW